MLSAIPTLWQERENALQRLKRAPRIAPPEVHPIVGLAEPDGRCQGCGLIREPIAESATLEFWVCDNGCDESDERGVG